MGLRGIIEWATTEQIRQLKQMLKKCDMKDTELCEYYQNRYDCMYGKTHGVKKCPYGKPLHNLYSEDSEDE